MIWNPLLLALGLVALPQDPPSESTEQEPAGETETEQEELTPDKAVYILSEAMKTKELDLIFGAIEDTGLVDDKRIVKLLGDALKHKDSEVRLEALKALRFNEHADALKALLKLKKNKAIVEDELCAEEYYFALGQKADKKAIDILSDDLATTNRGDKVTRARILSLGRIRDADSVKALIDVMNSGAGRRQHPQMREISTALTVLTGADHRMNRDAWQGWWNDNRKGLKLTKAEQELPSNKARAAWMTLWATPEDRELMELARKAGRTDFADMTPEELEELRKKVQEEKERREAGDDPPDDGEDF